MSSFVCVETPPTETHTPPCTTTSSSDEHSVPELIVVALDELAELRRRREELRLVVEREERALGRLAYAIDLGAELDYNEHTAERRAAPEVGSRWAGLRKRAGGRGPAST
ncbi:hypothetical protein V5O48_013874 [Marasmius crinis-equi]|uniref:Uncharacterized protein n=1 Tax=Marasmius crinis-equi TaxID=585013 RepID=A0ABR3EYV5_9AGAR